MQSEERPAGAGEDGGSPPEPESEGAYTLAAAHGEWDLAGCGVAMFRTLGCVLLVTLFKALAIVAVVIVGMSWWRGCH